MKIQIVVRTSVRPWVRWHDDCYAISFAAIEIENGNNNNDGKEEEEEEEHDEKHEAAATYKIT